MNISDLLLLLTVISLVVHIVLFNVQRGHPFKLFTNVGGLWVYIRASLFCERILTALSKLPDDTDSSSPIAFKRFVVNTDFSAFRKRF